MKSKMKVSSPHSIKVQKISLKQHDNQASTQKLSLILFCLCSHCVVPENIPHHRGNWKIRRGEGGGGSKVQENPEERGRGERINYFPEGQLLFIPM